VVKWDIIDVEEEFVMATAIKGAEGLNPSFDAIQVELKNLKDNSTWTMVE
jgi:hypothetical protein